MVMAESQNKDKGRGLGNFNLAEESVTVTKELYAQQ
jgi:hypothetical protein